MTYYIGIDPGITGAIALLEEDGLKHHVDDLPIIEIEGMREINSYELYMQLYDFDIFANSRKQLLKVVLEKVHSMPNQSMPSMFNFGSTYGKIKATVEVLQLPLFYITPQKWKKYFKLSKDKEECRQFAIHEFLSPRLTRKKDHNRAEALLLAKYGLENSL